MPVANKAWWVWFFISSTFPHIRKGKMTSVKCCVTEACYDDILINPTNYFNHVCSQNNSLPNLFALSWANARVPIPLREQFRLITLFIMCLFADWEVKHVWHSQHSLNWDLCFSLGPSLTFLLYSQKPRLCFVVKCLQPRSCWDNFIHLPYF